MQSFWLWQTREREGGGGGNSHTKIKFNLKLWLFYKILHKIKTHLNLCKLKNFQFKTKTKEDKFNQTNTFNFKILFCKNPLKFTHFYHKINLKFKAFVLKFSTFSQFKLQAFSQKFSPFSQFYFKLKAFAFLKKRHLLNPLKLKVTRQVYA